MALAVTEACANAIRHAYPSPGEARIKPTAWVDGKLFIVEIRDQGRLHDAETREAREGLGVTLMHRAADADVVPRASGGTDVRLAFPLS